MADATAISWCDSTFNPWIGCTKVSPACDHCYAERDTKRFGRVEWGTGKPRSRTSAANWKQPERWNGREFFQCESCGLRGEGQAYQDVHHGTGGVIGDGHKCTGCGSRSMEPGVRRRVFCASLADWLDNEVPVEWLVDFFDLVRRTPNLDWLMLSKRIGNWRKRMEAAADQLCNTRPFDAGGEPHDRVEGMVNAWLQGTPPSNVWIGATVVNQDEADRDVPRLLQVPARVRFLSVEPMLGPIDLSHRAAKALPIYWEGTQDDGLLPHYCGHSGNFLGYSARRGWSRYSGKGIDWIICGGESGPHARPMNPDWGRSLRDQCAAAGVPFHFKQWGEWAPTLGAHPTKGSHRWPIELSEPKGGNWSYRIGKDSAGRLLDGREHNEFPKT